MRKRQSVRLVRVAVSDLSIGGGTSRCQQRCRGPRTIIGIAAFTITSDGDGDGVVALVKSDLKYEGTEKSKKSKKAGADLCRCPRGLTN